MIYPMKFDPVFKETIWGGRNLRKLLDKKAPSGAAVGESWEVADHPHGTSVVANGALAGKTLHEVFLGYREELLGPALASRFRDRFPLLIKFIDAADRLSLQVHPDDEYARFHEDGSFGKTEAWYVMHAEPSSVLIAGLRPGTTREAFEKALAANDLEPLLNMVPVEAGDFLFIPAGRIHAIMPGILLNEIQQNSDITYRVYDWDRKDKDGRGRELHVRQSLETINFRDSNVRVVRSGQAEALDERRRLLIRSPFFTVEKWTFDRIDASTKKEAPGSCHILSVISGQGVLNWPGGGIELRPGDSAVVPWQTGGYGLVSASGLMTVLNSYI
jgi:mannose-6-phosphate isomerase